MISIPVKIKLLGDRKLAQEWIGPAMSQLNLLRNQMKFQNLKQGIRRLQLNKNIIVECQQVYDSSLVTIVARMPLIPSDERTTLGYYLLVVYDDYFVGTTSRIYKEVLDDEVVDLNTNLDIISPYDDVASAAYTWSKIYDDLIVLMYISGAGNIAARYNGIEIEPLELALRRLIPGESYCHLGFDLWREPSVISDAADDYYLGVMDDAGFFYKYKLRRNPAEEENDYSYSFEQVDYVESVIRLDYLEGECEELFPDESETSAELATKYGRLLGYGHINDEDIAWWGFKKYSSFYYKENLTTGVITTYQCLHDDIVYVLQTVIWHPIERKLYLFEKSDEYDETVGPIVTDLEVELADAPEGDYCSVNKFMDLAYGEGVTAPHYRLCSATTGNYTTSCSSTYTAHSKNLYESSYYFDTTFVYGGYRKQMNDVAVTNHFSTYYPATDTVFGGNYGITYIVNYDLIAPKLLFLGSIGWSNFGNPLSYTYRYKTLTCNINTEPEYSIDLPYCYWGSGYAETVTSGESTNADSMTGSFPDDLGWSSILLHGKDSADNTVTNWVIYRNQNTGHAYYVMTDTGVRYNLTSTRNVHFLPYREETTVTT